MNTLALSETVINRLGRVVDTDPACIAALDVFYSITAKLEATNPDLFRELDQAWIGAFCAARAAAWLDGWQCGREHGLLVFEPAEPDPDPVPLEWVMVADGVCIGLTADAAVDAWLGGAQ